MAKIQWTSSSSGDWSNAADWGGAVPQATDDVTIAVPNITVTVNSGTFAANSLTTSGSTLAITGGTLAVVNGANLNGAFAEGSGRFSFGEPSTFNDGVTLLGGTFAMANAATVQGSLSVGGPSTTFTQTAGLLTDKGTYAETNGTVTLEGGGVVFDAAVNVSGGGLETLGGGVFTSQQSYTQSGGSVFFAGSTVTFDGTALQTGGTMELGTSSLISNGSFTENGGTLTMVAFGGTFNALTLDAGLIQSDAPVLQLNGPYLQTGGTLSALGRGINGAGAFNEQAAGTIDVQTGALSLSGSATLGGKLIGGGTLRVNNGITSLASGVSISLANIYVAGGTLALGASMTLTPTFNLGSGASLNLLDHTLTSKGTSSLDGSLVGSGTYVLSGGGQINGLDLEGTTVLDVNTVVNVTGPLSLGESSGSRTLINIARTTGRLSIYGDSTISDISANGTIANAGYLTKSGGSDTAQVNADVISTGLISVNVGTLSFGGVQSSFAGGITGAGTFELAAGRASFAKALTLTVSRIVLGQFENQLTLTTSNSYAGAWDQLGGTLWLDGPAVSLTLSGRDQLNGGLLTGSGTLALAATSAVDISDRYDVEGTATLDVFGNVLQSGIVNVGMQFGSQPNVIIEKSATWLLQANAALGGTANDAALETGIITNDGLLEKVNGSAGSQIAGDLINNGTLLSGNSTLTLTGFGSLGGTVAGHGVIDLAGAYTLESGLSLSVGKLGIDSGVVSLATSLSDTGAITQSGLSMLDLGGNTLTVSGLSSLEGGTLGGPGDYVAKGALVIGDLYAISLGTLVVTGTADQTGDITIGDIVPTLNPPPATQQPASLATLQIEAGATYRLDNNATIGSNGTLSVAGTLTSLGGTETIGPSVVDTGSILGNNAHLTFMGPISGAGVICVGDGGLLEFASTVSSSTTIDFTTGTGSLLLDQQGEINGMIAGFVTGDVIEITGLSSFGGTLGFSDGGKVVTLSDPQGDSYSLTFTSAQSTATLALGVGAHGYAALFHT
jgi:hypothetical protein